MKIYLTVFLPLLTLGCSSSMSSFEYLSEEKIYDYEDVEHLMISWDQILDKDDKYFAYVYSETCGHCKEIKQVVLEKALLGKDAFYFVKYDKEIPVITNAELNIGCSSYFDLGIMGTPTLFEINNHTVISCYTGSNEILKTLTKN